MLIDALLAGMAGDEQIIQTDDPLVQVHNSVWQRVAKVGWMLPLLLTLMLTGEYRIRLLV